MIKRLENKPFRKRLEFGESLLDEINCNEYRKQLVKLSQYRLGLTESIEEIYGMRYNEFIYDYTVKMLLEIMKSRSLPIYLEVIEDNCTMLDEGSIKGESELQLDYSYKVIININTTIPFLEVDLRMSTLYNKKWDHYDMIRGVDGIWLVNKEYVDRFISTRVHQKYNGNFREYLDDFNLDCQKIMNINVLNTLHYNVYRAGFPTDLMYFLNNQPVFILEK